MSYFVVPAEDARRLTPQDLVATCYERDQWNVLFDAGSLRPDFFDLSSGVAGDFVQKLVNYGIRLAAVVPDVSRYSAAFRDFARECSRSGPVRFFPDRASAESWLSGSQEPSAERTEVMRFDDDLERFFEAVYREGSAPWDIGAPQSALIGLFDEFPVQDPVLDIGSGTGDLAIWLASQGHETIGVELSRRAVATARERARAIPADRLEFRVGNALRPSELGLTFGTVVDSGFYHLFEPDVCASLAQEVRSVLRPGGRYYVLAFAVGLPDQNVPRPISEGELRQNFGPERGWEVLAIRDAEFASRFGGTRALAACFERRD